MTTDFIHTEKGKLAYHSFGSGTRKMIALHGFAESGADFKAFAEALATEYTLIALDLPHHGQSKWDSNIYTQEDLLMVLEQIIEQKKWTKFDLLGHSLGGELILSFANRLSEYVEHIFLLAPGGIEVKGMQIPDLIPFSFRKIINSLLKQPSWLLNLSDWVHKIGLIDAYSRKFLHHHLGDPAKQQRMLSTWVSKHYFKIRRKQFLDAIEQDNIQVWFLLGKGDPLISPEKIKQWSAGHPQIHIELLNAGHRLVRGATAEKIKELIKA